MQSIRVKLTNFEGPLDLLYHLIEKNQIDIYDIPIVTVTDQYLEYLDSMPERDMESMSEFLVMAATLLEIKSKMLLPRQNEDEKETEDPREELMMKLLEYKKFKAITEELRDREVNAAQYLYRQKNDLFYSMAASQQESLEDFLGSVTRKDIYLAFEEVMRRKEKKVDKIRSSFRGVTKDLFTVEEKIGYIRDLLIVSPKVRFSHIFREDSSKMEIVVTFLALLELMKRRQVGVVQEKNFTDMIISRIDGSEAHETNTAGSGD